MVLASKSGYYNWRILQQRRLFEITRQQMNIKLKEYVAIIWKKNSDAPGIHEKIYAKSYEEVEAIIKEKYGDDLIVSLTDVEAAARPR
jgi:hypothetical protein